MKGNLLEQGRFLVGSQAVTVATIVTVTAPVVVPFVAILRL